MESNTDRVANYKALESCSNLKKLHIGQLQHTDLQFLEFCPGLEELDLNLSHNIVNWTGMQFCKNLVNLKIDFNFDRQYHFPIEILQSMNNLKEVTLSNLKNISSEQIQALQNKGITVNISD